MRVVFLGTGAAGGPPWRARSCVLVDAGARVVLDFGDGCGSRLAMAGLGLGDMDLVYISHVHPDHYSGLFDALVSMLARGSTRTVRIVAHRVVAMELARILDQYLTPSLRSLVHVDAVEDLVQVGGLRLRLVRVEHSVPAYGVVVEERGATVFYMGDGRLSDNVRSVMAASALSIVEATMPSSLCSEAWRVGHTCVREVVEAAAGAGGLVAAVHLSVESERELLGGARLPGNLLVPMDLSVVGVR